MIASKSGGDEKKLNETTINNIKANTQSIDVTIYVLNLIEICKRSQCETGV